MSEPRIVALFVETNGVYFNDPRIDPWDIERDAMKYKGPHKVIAHPPCKRWGRYWGGGPMLHNTPKQKLLGDDECNFAYALWCVRTFGGVIEHPEASHAWSYYGLSKPPRNGGWIEADSYGGWTCCVSQGNYGHRAQKLTWLYAVRTKRPELKWGLTPNRQRLDEGFHSAKERNEILERRNRTSKAQNISTPKEFKELLIELVS